ncbi:response regulator [Sphingomicrobium arenosum]|uniref:response regulator n=1 Tax=Sphingomicrobium arenosum TaxID=2233861 RepID=UPI00223FE389|nr:response regulator transcription factor [Sphingomicrobium arenosum]
MIRVFLVDDQMLVRQGIRGLLDLLPDIEVIGEASDGLDAIDQLDVLRPDVMLLDIRMPRVDGIAVLERLLREGRQPPTLVLTTFDDSEAVIAAIRAGAKGVMLKDVSLDDLASAIRALADERTALHPGISASLVAAIRRGPAPGRRDEAIEPLTSREQDVLHLICAGCSNREIADALEIAEGTVKNHVSNLLLKLDARDRTRAALKAIRAGLLG